MVLENILEILPFFVFILLVLSYLMWSKFLNKTKLGIKNVNHMLDILLIFIFLLASIGGFVILFLMFLGIINLNFDLGGIIQITPFLISLLGILFLISFVMGYRNKRGCKEDLEDTFKEIIKYYFVFAIFLGVYYIFIFLFTPLNKFIGSNLLIAFFFSVIILSFCWNIVANVLFGERGDKFFNKDTIKLLAGIFIFVLVLSFLITPLVNHKEIEHQRIKIYEINRGKLQQEFLFSKINVSLTTLGILTSIPSLIVLDYGKYGLILEDNFKGNNFEVRSFSNKTGTNIFISSYSDITNFNEGYSNLDGLKGLELKDNSLAIKFDGDKFKRNEINYFVIKGLVNISVSDNQFNYKDNTGYSEVCHGDGCHIKIWINNSLYLPVDIERTVLLNLNNRNVENISACKFEKINSKYEFEGDYVKYESQDCGNSNSCNFEIRRQREDGKFYYDFRMELSNEGGGVIGRHYTNIEEPIKIELNAYLKC